MKKGISIFLKWLMIGSFFSYVISNYYNNQIVSNILSPIVAFTAVFLIVTRVKKRTTFRNSWFFIALAILSWGISDLFWMIQYNFLNLDPEASVFLSYLYMLPNVFLLLAAIMHYRKTVEFIHRLQLIVDISVASLFTIILIWSTLISQVDFFAMSFHNLIANTFYVLTDGILLALLLVVFTSTKNVKMTHTLKWSLAGFTLYILIDLIYVYSSLLDIYTPNTIIDSIYILSFVLFGLGATCKIEATTFSHKSTGNEIHRQNPAIRLVAFMIFPTLMLTQNYMRIEIFGVLLSIMLFYFIVSDQIQKAIKKELLLYQEKELTEKLETMVAQRTEALTLANKQLEIVVRTDEITGIPNRRYFLEQLDELIEKKENDFILFYMDLDNFKIINDIHGHEMGDQVLKAVGERLVDYAATHDFVARLGGDEFGLIHILNKESSDETAYRIGHELINQFKEEILVDDYAFDISLSIGISRYPNDADSRILMVKHADLAMYQAKKNTIQSRFEIFSHAHGATMQRRKHIELMLKSQKCLDEFYLVYQPQFNIETNELIGMEALLRWSNDELGQIPPNEFIQIAEETNNIVSLGNWVIDNTFRQIAVWNQKYGLDLSMGINLSPLQFDSKNFIAQIQSKLKAFQVNPKWIDFEITETSTMKAGVAMEELFTAMSSLGVQISIDDFGTGYSSLSYIKRFDIDQLKIAKELIDHIVENEDERLIIKAIILMAKGLDLKTIAEGVEDASQLAVLKSLGCNLVQGYYFGFPEPMEAFENKYLKKEQ